MASVFAELKRRNVFRVAGVYVVVGWLLVQVGTSLEETLGLPAWFDTLIVALLILGMPVALVFAWAFELTPEGVVRTEAVPEGKSITTDTGRKLDVAIVIGLALLVAMIIWQQLSDTAEPAPEAAAIADSKVTNDTSIAVLPFADLSQAGDQEYFSDGIAEEILNVLVRVQGLDVTSRTSSFQFKEADLGIPEIAETLNVRHVVEGSVRKSGETIRVTAQLIDASNDKHLWSDTYDRPLTAENIFEIQDEIANAIVAALSDALGIDELEAVEVVPSTENITAYELYLQARPLFLARVNLDRADELLEQALRQDPEFVEAWEIRSALQTLKVEYGYSDVPLEEAGAMGKAFARRALSYDPNSAMSMAVIAKTDSNAAQNLQAKPALVEVGDLFSRALELEPRNASALLWRGIHYLHVGNLDASLKDFRTCLEYEPYYVPCVENLTALLSVSGRDEESLQAYLAALNNGTTKVQFAPFMSLARLGEELAFKTAANDAQLLQGFRRHDELYEAYRHPEGDYSDLLAAIRRHLESGLVKYSDMYSFIAHPLGTGWEIPSIGTLWDSSMQRYRQTQEFKSYIRDSGAFEYWQQAGFPSQCRPIGDDDFECD